MFLELCVFTHYRNILRCSREIESCIVNVSYLSIFIDASLPEKRLSGLEGASSGGKHGEEIDRKAEGCLPDDTEGVDDDDPTHIAHYSIYALHKLQQLNDKLAQKHDALKALTASDQRNPKVRNSIITVSPGPQGITVPLYLQA